MPGFENSGAFIGESCVCAIEVSVVAGSLGPEWCEMVSSLGG